MTDLNDLTTDQLDLLSDVGIKSYMSKDYEDDCYDRFLLLSTKHSLNTYLLDNYRGEFLRTAKYLSASEAQEVVTGSFDGIKLLLQELESIGFEEGSKGLEHAYELGTDNRTGTYTTDDSDKVSYSWLEV